MIFVLEEWRQDYFKVVGYTTSETKAIEWQKELAYARIVTPLKEEYVFDN